MARVNLEDRLFGDIRFMKLISLCNGDPDKALGLVMRCFWVTSKFWLEFRGIPKKEWHKQNLGTLLIECGLAEEQPGEIMYLAGSAAQCKYIDDASKKGKWKRKGQHKKEQQQSTAVNSSQPRPSSYSSSSLQEIQTTLSSAATTPQNDAHEKKDSAPIENRLTPTGLLELWNSHCGTLPKAKGLNKKRQTIASARVREHPDPDYWVKVVKQILSSSFHKGSNSGGWVANFDYFIRPDTHLKATEGHFGKKESSWSL